jgi:5-formyltetrahydrofolate cyclo-ligase
VSLSDRRIAFNEKRAEIDDLVNKSRRQRSIESAKQISKYRHLRNEIAITRLTETINVRSGTSIPQRIRP